MSVAGRIRQEVREIGLVTSFFLVWFLVFLFLKKLILAEYHIGIPILSTAIVGALVVAKVVVILDKTPVATRFRDSYVLLHLLWRSVSYTGFVLVVTILERLFHGYRETGALRPAVVHLWETRDVHHALAMVIAVGMAFVVFNAASEIDRRLGEHGLRRFLLSRPARSGAAGEPESAG